MRLDAVFLQCRNTPFDWDSQIDCSLGLAVPAILAQTGVDLGTEWRGTYHSPRQALKEIRRRGFQSLPDVVAEHFAAYPHPSAAGLGDIAAVRSDETGWSLGIFTAQNIALMLPHGLEFLPRTARGKPLAEQAFGIEL